MSSVTNNNSNSSATDTNSEDNHVRRVRNTLKGIGSAKHAPSRYAFLPSKMLSKSTQAGIIDKAAGPKGKWLFRLDNPHKGVDFAHININPKVTGVPDPHIQIPGSIVKGSGTAVKAIQVAGKAAAVVAVVADGYRIGSAVFEDIKKKKKLGKRTAKTVSSTAGGWLGGFGGAVGGNTLGALVGGAIGGFFGGVGAAPGAVVGSFVCGLIGGIGGSIGAEAFIDWSVSDSESEDDHDE